MKVKKTRPYTSRTNGKAERFIKTLLEEWAYVMPYGSSEARIELLPVFLRNSVTSAGAAWTWARVSPPSRGSLSCRHEQLGGKPQLGSLIAFLPLLYLCKVI